MIQKHQKSNKDREKLYGHFMQEGIEQKAQRDEEAYLEKIKRGERYEAERAMR